MVLAAHARKDVDDFLLTKTIIYIPKVNKNAKSDLSFDIEAEDTTEYSIKAQCTIQNEGSNYVKEGRVLAGDLVGLFRHEYTQEADGTIITPTLIPQQESIIEFLGRKYRVKDCTPATSEDDAIIAWDFTAGQIE